MSRTYTPTQTCQVIKSYTDKGDVLCRRPAHIILHENLPDMACICDECAIRLVRELSESLAGKQR